MRRAGTEAAVIGLVDDLTLIIGQFVVQGDDLLLFNSHGIPFVLINSTRKVEALGLKDWMLQHPEVQVYSFPASDLAERHLGRPMANVGMVAGFAAVTGAITKASVEQAIKNKFPGKIGELNALAAAEAFDYVSSMKIKV